MVARRAALWPLKLCRAVLEGMRNQLTKDRRLESGLVGIQQIIDEDVDLEVLKASDHRRDNPRRYFDDITGQELDPLLVEAARRRELEYFESKEVWEITSMKHAIQQGGRKPISVRWVDVNKGDDDAPNIRSRLVAREIRAPGTVSIFAPTPPLEALRTILRLATTRLPGESWKHWGSKHDDRMQIRLIDISRAYFNAKVDPRAQRLFNFRLNTPSLVGRNVDVFSATCMGLRGRQTAGRANTVERCCKWALGREQRALVFPP